MTGLSCIFWIGFVSVAWIVCNVARLRGDAADAARALSASPTEPEVSAHSGNGRYRGEPVR